MKLREINHWTPNQAYIRGLYYLNYVNLTLMIISRNQDYGQRRKDLEIIYSWTKHKW